LKTSTFVFFVIPARVGIHDITGLPLFAEMTEEREGFIISSSYKNTKIYSP